MFAEELSSLLLLLLYLFGLLGLVVIIALLVQKYAPEHARSLKYELEPNKSTHEIRDELLAGASNLKEYTIPFAGNEAVQFKRSFEPDGKLLIAVLFSWLALLFYVQHQGQICTVSFFQKEDGCTVQVSGPATKELRELLDKALTSS